MAQITKEELFDMLRDIVNEAGGSQSSAGRSSQDPDKAFKAVDDALKRLQKQLGNTTDSYAKKAQKAKRVLDATEREIEAVEALIEQLDEQGKTSEAAAARNRQTSLQEIRNSAEKKAATAGLVASLTDGKKYTAAFGQTIKTVGATTSDVLNKLQSNAGAASVANTALSAGLGLAGQAGSKLGEGMTAAGSAAMMTKHPLAKLSGGALIAAGSLLKIGSPAVTAAMKFALEYLGKEFENIAQGFSKLSHAGALFTDGMTGMKNASATAALTLQQFGAVVEKNRANLVQSGVGVSAATDLLAKTSGTIRSAGNNVGRQLNNLGYTFQEQAELIAETMGNLGRTGGLAGMGQDQIAEATLETAKSMKYLAGLASEDAKVRRESTRKANDEIGFRSKLLQLEKQYGAGYAKKVEDAMAKLDPNVAQMVRELDKYGSIITPSLAVMASNIPAMGEAANQFHSQMRAGAIDQETALRIQGRANDAIRRDAEQAGGTIATLGQARQGIGLDTAKALESTLANAIAMSSEAVEQTIQRVNQAANTADEETKKFIEAQKANQAAMVAAQKLAFDNMSRYAELVKDVNTALEAALKKALEISQGGTSGVFGMLKDSLVSLAAIIATVGAGIGVSKLSKGFRGGSGGPSAGTGLFAAGGTPPTPGTSAAGVGSSIARFGKAAVGGAGSLAGGLALGYASGKATEAGHTKTGAALDIGSTALSGAGTGALIGSVVPGVGTAIGGALGGVAGAGYGLYQNWSKLLGGSASPASGASMLPQAAPETMSAVRSGSVMELRDLMKKQFESSSQISAMNETMVSLMRDNNNIMRQLSQALA
jgi:hypothetical protein